MQDSLYRDYCSMKASKSEENDKLKTQIKELRDEMTEEQLKVEKLTHTIKIFETADMDTIKK